MSPVAPAPPTRDHGGRARSLRATAGPKGVALGDSVSDFGPPGGKGGTKAKEEAAAVEKAGPLVLSKARPAPPSRGLAPKVKAALETNLSCHSGGGAAGSGGFDLRPRSRGGAETGSPDLGLAGRPILIEAAQAREREIGDDLVELRDNLRHAEEVARARGYAAGGKECG